jgi:hypothetical protein
LFYDSGGSSFPKTIGLRLNRKVIRRSPSSFLIWKKLHRKSPSEGACKKRKSQKE